MNSVIAACRQAIVPVFAARPSLRSGSVARRRPFGTGEIRSFTGLRGCAAVLVMLYHFEPPGTVAGPVGVLIGNGYLWVDMFFVLSGFVMAYAHEGLFAAGGWGRPHAAFLAKRLARIYPLYLLVTVESAALYLWRAPHVDYARFSASLLANLALVQAWGTAPSFEGDVWSISAEWAAYLAFPALLAAAVFSSRKRAAAAGVIAAVTVAVLAVAPGSYAFSFQGRMGPLDIYSSATPAPLLRCLAEFTIGLLSFRAARYWARLGFTGAGTAAVLAAAGILALMARPGCDLAVVALIPLLLTSLAAQRGMVSWLLGSPGPYLLGELSYSIYLIHDKFVRLDEVLCGALAGHTAYAAALSAAITSAVVIGCAAVTYTWIEKPCRRYLASARRWPGARHRVGA